MAENELLSAIIKRLTHALAETFAEQLRRHGITLAQWGVLRHLWEHEGRSQVELQTLLRVEAATITGLLQRLERYGLIYRQADEHDKRMQRVFLTNEGRALAPKVRHLAEDINLQAFGDFSPEEHHQLRHLLTRALHNLTTLGEAH
ncbi:MAG: MarR family transcriptional regulator [Ktedonobacteraceae bacterium]|nr:MarR family transcriptional regulator [Ktedonobacteraceae bacterium]MBA3822563.1 MarR family transcriptional regulator [Ktedonobacterales bacterium]